MFATAVPRSFLGLVTGFIFHAFWAPFSSIRLHLVQAYLLRSLLELLLLAARCQKTRLLAGYMLLFDRSGLTTVFCELHAPLGCINACWLNWSKTRVIASSGQSKRLQALNMIRCSFAMLRCVRVHACLSEMGGSRLHRIRGSLLHGVSCLPLSKAACSMIIAERSLLDC